MKQIVADGTLPSKLAVLLGPVELVDADGFVLGVFKPNPERVARLDPGLSEEEVRRRLAEPGGRTLAEIMADLERQR